MEVWSADSEGRYSIAGYGVGVVPFQAGQTTLEIKCWRPRPLGWYKWLSAKILGVQPELSFKDTVISSADRFGFECESTGTVEIQVGIIHKDFGIHGVNLQPGMQCT